MLIAVLLLLAGVLLLWGSAEALVKGAVYLGRRAGVSPVVVGLTVVSIGTSAPELVVCIAAALDGSPDIAVGNVLGSNLANIGLILGLAVVIRPMTVANQVVFRELPWMLGVTVLVFPLLLNLEMGRVEGGVLAAVLLVYLYFLSRVARESPADIIPADLSEEAAAGAADAGSRRDLLGPVLFVAGGSLGLVLGGRSIVTGGTSFAELLGVPEMIVGLSIVALGTSLPELATSVVAALRDEGDLAVGNIVGSNIFNLTFVLGGTALVQPFRIQPSVLRVEFPAVLVISLALIPLVWINRRLGRFAGGSLLGLYAGAWVWILVAG